MQHRAGVGQRDAAGRTVEQPDADAFLKIADGMADGGGRDTALFAGPAKLKFRATAASMRLRSANFVRCHRLFVSSHEMLQHARMLDSSGLALAVPPISENNLSFAARRLRQACVACELVPGSYVHEAALSEIFGLGRAAVRVALTELAAAGFVSRHPRQGWRVADVDGALATGIIEARRLLEPALVNAVLDDGQRVDLRNWRAMMQAIEGRDDSQARAMAHHVYRQALDLLAAQCGPLVVDWLRDLWDHTERLQRALELAGRPVSLGDSGHFLDSMLAGDRATALAALTEGQARFKAAIAEAFLGAARLAPAGSRMRKRGTGKAAFPPFASPSVTEETSR